MSYVLPDPTAQIEIGFRFLIGGDKVVRQILVAKVFTLVPATHRIRSPEIEKITWDV